MVHVRLVRPRIGRVVADGVVRRRARHKVVGGDEEGPFGIDGRPDGQQVAQRHVERKRGQGAKMVALCCRVVRQTDCADGLGNLLDGQPPGLERIRAKQEDQVGPLRRRRRRRSPIGLLRLSSVHAALCAAHQQTADSPGRCRSAAVVRRRRIAHIDQIRDIRGAADARPGDDVERVRVDVERLSGGEAEGMDGVAEPRKRRPPFLAPLRLNRLIALLPHVACSRVPMSHWAHCAHCRDARGQPRDRARG